MRGQYDCSESLFYYFRIEDRLPENRLLSFDCYAAVGKNQRVMVPSNRPSTRSCR